MDATNPSSDLATDTAPEPLLDTRATAAWLGWKPAWLERRAIKLGHIRRL